MSNSKELRKRAWQSLKGKYWMAFAVVLVTGLIGSVGSSFISFGQNLSEVLGLVDPAEMDSTMAIGALVLNGVVIISAIIGGLYSIFVTDALTVGVNNYFIRILIQSLHLQMLFQASRLSTEETSDIVACRYQNSFMDSFVHHSGNYKKL